jgi:hypothetical protein
MILSRVLQLLSSKPIDGCVCAFWKGLDPSPHPMTLNKFQTPMQWMTKSTPAVTNIESKSDTTLFMSSSAALVERANMSPTPDGWNVIPRSVILGSDVTISTRDIHGEVVLGRHSRYDPEERLERTEFAVPSSESDLIAPRRAQTGRTALHRPRGLYCGLACPDT